MLTLDASWHLEMRDIKKGNTSLFSVYRAGHLTATDATAWQSPTCIDQHQASSDQIGQ